MTNKNIADISTQRTSDKSHQMNSSDENELIKIKNSLRLIKRIVSTFIVLLAIILIGALGIYFYHHSSATKQVAVNPVPINIRGKVKFDVYFPVQSKLPNGYSLDINSFTANNVAVIYSVDFKSNIKLTFSIQQKPSPSDIQLFYSKYLPLHLIVNTPIGIGSIGVIGSQTVASLPTNTNSWVLITGPKNTNTNDLINILKSMKK